jgi:hypothetical protein
LSSPVCQTCLIDLYRKMTEHFRPELFDDSDTRDFILREIYKIVHHWRNIVRNVILLYEVDIFIYSTFYHICSTHVHGTIYNICSVCIRNLFYMTVQGSSWSCSYSSWIYNYLRNKCLSPLYRCEFESHSWRDVLDSTLCDKVFQWLATGQWFSPGTPVFSTNKTDSHDITEILLKVAPNTITTNNPYITVHKLEGSLFSTHCKLEL